MQDLQEIQPVRDERGRLLPGSTANRTGGRSSKAVKAIRDQLRAGCPEAAKFLVATVKNKKESTRDRIAAAKIMFEYSMSKPRPKDADPLRAKEPTGLESASEEVLEQICRLNS